MFIALGLAFLFGSVYYAQFYGNPLSRTASQEEVVKEFGTHLKNVSLLGEAEDVARAMEEHYGPFVDPDTLAAWKADPQSAPGRLTSSPWPDRIDVAATGTPIGSNEYRVEGVVVEMTSDNILYGGETIGYPVVVMLKHNASWQIVSFASAMPGELPADTPTPQDSLVGTYVCLPHLDPNRGTKECSFGIQVGDTLYYALDFSVFTTEQGLTLATGERIRVEGQVTPLAAIPPNDPLRIYNIQGVVRVSTMSHI